MEAGLSKESLGEEVHSYSDGCQWIWNHVVAVVVTFIWMVFSFQKDRVHVQLLMGVSWLKQGAKGWSFIPLPQNPYYTVVDFKLLWQQAVWYIFYYKLFTLCFTSQVWHAQSVARWFYILEKSTMNAMREASSRFSMFINKPISSPLEWQNSLREFYILEKSTMNAIQEAFSRFFMPINGYISFPF